ncbi:MAG: peptide ABC transporter substrate-binding protein [Pirellulales bacterium]|nr:peptide ABC transporter substrate-binding protein [Pirellulales bacterium]
MFSRRDIALLVAAVAGLAAALGWSLTRTALPRADFTFCNGTEVKSLDPALVTGQPEGRLAYALFEGLVRWHPRTLEPLPSGARRWEISDDRLQYTFFLQPDAKWSDGSPVTAGDYAYSLRRFLDPRTAAEYAFQAWYLKNGKRYSEAAAALRPGDQVEVELNLTTDASNAVRGEVLRGKLVQIEDGRGEILDAERLAELAERENVDRQRWTYAVEIDGRTERFRYADDSTAAAKPPSRGARWCRQILIDFRDVGVEVLDDLTLRLTLENPTSYFLSLLGFYPLFPVNQACVERHGSPQWTYAENMVANGPYRQLFRRYRDRTRLIRSETYWDRDNVALETVDVLAVDSIYTALNLYLTGEADWIHEAPPNALRVMLEENPPRDDLNPAPMLNTYYYLLNVRREPLDDVRVRRALSMAIDREEICTKILAVGEQPALSLVPPGLPGYDPPETPGYDPAAARQLLAEAGYPGGRGFPRLEVSYNTHETHQLIAEVVRKQWERNLGIVVKGRNEEWGSFLASQRQSRFDVSRKGWIGDYADPNTFLDLFVAGGEQNNTNWGRPEYDALIDLAKVEPDPTKRLAALREAEELLMDELPIIPVFFYVSKNLVKPHVRGFHNNIQDYHPLWPLRLDRSGETPHDFLESRR